MGMEHKAFVFDYDQFKSLLADRLRTALQNADPSDLIEFINQNQSKLRHPTTGQALSDNWIEELETEDVHDFGNIALTLFYDPVNDIGLGANWERIQLLAGKARQALFGSSFGPDGNCFDPGHMGSYFQSKGAVEDNLKHLNEQLLREPNLAEELAPLKAMLKQAAAAGKGLYITF